MSNTFKLGKFELTSWIESRFAMDGGAIFGVVPKTLWSKDWPTDDQNRIENVTRCLLLKTGQRNILIECGLGQKLNHKMRGFYKVREGGETLAAALGRLSLKPDEITDVLLTHLHFDHAGGATRLQAGEVAPALPKARYYVSRAQFDWALKPTVRDRASYLEENYLPLKTAGCLELLAGDGELFEGVSAIQLQGHTPGQLAFCLRSEGESLIFASDLFPTASHLHLPFIMAYDLQPLAVLEEKRRVLEQAIADKAWIFFYHDPRYAMGKVQYQKEKYSGTEFRESC